MSFDPSSARSFAVVTDSTSDIDPALAAQRGITIVPLLVSFGEESFLDGTITQPEFFDRMGKAPTLPTTSQPSVGAFNEAYTAALETADEVISIHISSALSGTMGSATQAASEFDGRVHVFDSRNLSWGCALQVLDAVAAADEGLTAAQALERLESTRTRSKMIVGVDSLDNLSRGGRIGKVSAFMGSLLNLKVTFTVDEDGAFAPVHRSRGEKAAIADTLTWVDEQMQGHSSAIFAVGHAMSLPRAERIAEQLESRYDVKEMHIYEAGTVIATHTGTVWGVSLLPL